MRSIRVDQLSLTEAEAFIALLWRILEEDGIPSPRLRVKLRGGSVDLVIEFPSLSQQNAERVRQAAMAR